ncbi:MAG: hypothetical protein H7Z72_07290 [Bacteroidetes bacterium]|nr:hypothetical protein [Fibrella sp.]
MKITQTHLYVAPLALTLTVLPLTALVAQSEPTTARPKMISIENIFDLTHTLTPGFPYNPVSGYYYPFRATTMTTIKSEGSNARR